MNHSPKSINLQTLALALIRLGMNINIRMMYPFLPILAGGLGISVAELSVAVSSRSLVSGLTPFVSHAITERKGRKAGLLTGIGMFILANLLVVIWPRYVTLFISLCISGLGTTVYFSALQAYLGDVVSYEKRGRMIALVELSWSMAYFIGMPLIAFLLSHFGWVGPFPVLAGVGLVGFLLVQRIVPYMQPVGDVHPRSPFHGIGKVLSYPPALAGLIMGMLFSSGNEMVSIVFGVWMKDSFGLQIAGLGLASAVLGIAEASGESLTAALMDRLGKERSIRIGVLINSLAILVLPWIGHTAALALGGLFVYYLAWEILIISVLPLMTEVMPEARGTLLGLNLASFSIGRALGALVSPHIYLLGFQYNVIVVVIINLVAVVLLTQVKLRRPAVPETSV